jgi:hypothetical protein
LVGDVTGDGRADVVGFGETGVYVARAAGGGAFNPVQFPIPDLGYASGWRVDRHPRFLADLRNRAAPISWDLATQASMWRSATGTAPSISRPCLSFRISAMSPAAGASIGIRALSPT